MHLIGIAAIGFLLLIIFGRTAMMWFLLILTILTIVIFVPAVFHHG